MKSRKPMTFETVPEWAIDSEDRSRYMVAAAFHLAGMMDKWVRLTADSQRKVFGLVLFGKCRMMVTDTGIRVIRSVCFGTDFSEIVVSWESLERYMQNQTRPVI